MIHSQSLDVLVCFDRDDTITFDPGYLADPNGVVLIPGVREALEKIYQNNVSLALVTNQSGVGRGLITEEQLDQVQNKLYELLYPVQFFGTYICKHAPQDHCFCRKPKPGLIQEAIVDFTQKKGKPPQKIFMVGDRPTDLLAGRNAGCQVVFVPAFHKGFQVIPVDADFIAKNLQNAVDWILQQIN